ncbi:hypothetical protein [Inhella gelatinilytica]|uniref:Lipoprotein n=1 Tax=Inhella gelatinilytica TaxID=2795030 RepID=A0A931NDA8_9BURK|nr:hypothetical protein [Inhella gelatinilytica]MBH9551256.1 hypothetical protein [Inhella gelatinilytica]
MKHWTTKLGGLALLGLGACGGGGELPPPAPPASVPTPAGTAPAAILFLGNSHTHVNNVPELVRELFQQGGGAVAVQAAPDYLFLDERLSDGRSVALLASAGWTHVVLQAQKLSSSWQFIYPTAEAQEWVRRVKERQALPVLFPEWPRAGQDEAGRIYAVYESIAKASPACLAPVPQAFDRVRSAWPELPLYAADGNHSSPAGALLAAFVLYASASGKPLEAGPPLLSSPVDAASQALLREQARASLAAGPSARAYCP